MKLKSTQLYYSGLHQFSMEIPKTWTMKTSALPTTAVKFVYRESAKKVAVLSVSIFKSASNLTTEDMANFLKSEHATAVALESGTTKITGYDAVWNIIEVTEPADAKLIGKYYHLRHNNQLWRIAATTDCGREFFDASLPAMEEVVASLKFEKPPGES